MIVGQEKPSLDELAHFGVKGMKWGVRTATPTAKQIRVARSQVLTEASRYNKAARKLKTTTGENRKKLEVTLNKRRQRYLNNPNRAIAARMTRGEKALSVILGLEAGGVGVAGSVASIATSSAISRGVAYKQKNKKYKVDPNAKARRTIGYDQLAFPLISAGAALVPSLARAAGSKAAVAIGTRAAAKRAAAKGAAKGAAGVGATAAKLKYVKPGLRGAYRITTLK